MSKELSFSIKRSLPVMCGFLVLGMAFGLTFHEAGYGLPWTLATSVFVYAGSMQFVLIGLITSGASIFSAAVMALAVNGRHMFYGLTFIDRFRAQGKRYPYMVFSLTDETYSLLVAGGYPEGLNAANIDFYIALLNHIYWVTGSALGALIGEVISFDLRGVDFSMTALFVVILVEQLRDKKCRLPALMGFCSALIALLLLGAKDFLLPALAVTVALTLIFRGPIERTGGEGA